MQAVGYDYSPSLPKFSGPLRNDLLRQQSPIRVDATGSKRDRRRSDFAINQIEMMPLTSFCGLPQPDLEFRPVPIAAMEFSGFFLDIARIVNLVDGISSRKSPASLWYC